MKICFLVLSADYPPWRDLFSKCGKITWANVTSQEIEFDIFEYRGKSLPPIYSKFVNFLKNSKLKKIFWKRTINNHKYVDIRMRNSELLECKVSETWDNIMLKTLAAINFALNYKDYDYIIRINTTTYVNLSELQKYLMTTPKYAGASSEKNFAPGWSIILSRESAEKLVRNANFPYNQGLRNDDHSIGDILSGFGIYPWQTSCSIVTSKMINPKHKQDIQRSVFTRIKSESADREQDSELFELVHKYITESSETSSL